MAFVGLPRLLESVEFHVPDDPAAQDVICNAGGGLFLVGRPIHDRLVPFLTGEHTLADLVRHAGGKLGAVEVAAAVQWLARHGAVVDAAREGPWRVAVGALGLPADDDLHRALEGAGLIVSEAAAAGLNILLADHYLREELADQNRRETGPWLLVRPDSNLWLGPLIVPGKSACWECLAQRLRFNGRIDRYLLSVTGQLPTATAAGRRPNPTRATLFALAAQAARQFLATGRSPLVNALLSLDAGRLETTRHRLVRRPQCPACGTAPRAGDMPPRLEMEEEWTERSGDRDAAARRTLDRFAHHISPVTGLVPNLTAQSRLPGIHVYAGGPYIVKASRNWRMLERSMRFCGSGKGTTADIARAGAFAETLEWYTLNSQDPGVLEIDTFAKLSLRARCIPPPALIHFSAQQFAEREVINRRAASWKEEVPEPFDPEVPFGWLKLWSLTQREWAYVPGRAVAHSFECPFVNRNSNGSAAGASLPEAVVHGALEIVERDAIALWWYNFIPRPLMSLDDVDAGLIAAMRREYGRIGRRFWVLDISSDLGIPAAAAISTGDDRTQGDLVMGFGAHFDPAIAATRALTEMNQLQKKLVDTVPRDDRTGTTGGGSTAIPPHIHPDPNASARPLAAQAGLARAAPSEQIDWLVQHFRAHGLELLVGDLTLPDVGLPVAKVMAPGLRPSYPELGPGRLHDVPLARGWIRDPVPEARMRELPTPL